MKKFILISFTLIVLIVSVTLIRLPLNLIAPTINNLFPQVTYTSIEGTIWSGKIKNLSFADEFIGSFNTQFNLRNLSFLIDIFSDKNFKESGFGVCSVVIIR